MGVVEVHNRCLMRRFHHVGIIKFPLSQLKGELCRASPILVVCGAGTEQRRSPRGCILTQIIVAHAVLLGPITDADASRTPVDAMHKALLVDGGELVDTYRGHAAARIDAGLPAACASG